ncbi:MAG: di-trans,poly-cis-decaprenylcistransferase [Desulfovibrionaceae bacterium]|jgi:undecaprenyl diphosphate synthase|nr:di-trans,poly-cis-decaprenylcistransferase [Desulfovibrionaceae bacterium]
MEKPGNAPRTIPVHLAIIMDGNGRWAEQRGLPRSKGHQAGTEAAKAVVTACRERGIRHLTLYTFSKENWARPKDEVSFLFDLLVAFLKRELDNLVEQSIQLRVLGDFQGLPFAVRKALEHAMARTRHGEAMILNLALNYSGRAEIVHAARALAADGLAGEAITEEAIAERLYTSGQPDPDLIIRTSGEMRLSNYLLFQAAYSEFHFTETLWPDFDAAALDEALAAFGRRDRRYGARPEHGAPSAARENES